MGGPGGKASGFREIPVPRPYELNRTEDQDLRAALVASAAESRVDRVELAARRKLEKEQRRQSETNALSTYKALRSRELARECKQQESRRAALAAQAVADAIQVQ